MGSMGLKTETIIVIAALCIFWVATPGICQSIPEDCWVKYGTDYEFPTFTNVKNYTAASQLVRNIIAYHYSCPAPPIQDVLDSCREGCCYDECSLGDSTRISVLACTDGLGSITTHPFPIGTPTVDQFQWKVLCCEDDSDCPDGFSCTGEGECVSDFIYNFAHGGIAITGYTGSGGDVVIPSEIGGVPVVRIEYRAFVDSITLTSVTIPDSVTFIESEAFLQCTNLTSVTIAGSDVVIDTSAFRLCHSLSVARFLADAPSMNYNAFLYPAPDFKICYTPRSDGFTSPTWKGYPASDCTCGHDFDCPYSFCTMNSRCLEGACVTEMSPCDDDLICDDLTERCVECLTGDDCIDEQICYDGMCILPCTLNIRYKEIRSEKLLKPLKRVLRITTDHFFGLEGEIDLGPLLLLNKKSNDKKGLLTVAAEVPAGLKPGIIPISIGECTGEIEIQ
jgi:hypothetical protein